MQQPPAIPPRPAKNQDKDNEAGGPPKIPPRPAKRPDRSISPNVNRFAPSPLNAGIPPKSPNTSRLSLSPAHADSDDPIDRSGSVPMPSVGEEGVEYSAVTHELKEDASKNLQASSPEQTRTVAEDLQLHAPKPSLPAHSAKQRVMTVTRTDSDRAASYGIGRPGEERAASRDGHKKKTNTSFSTTSESQPIEDEHGIPEIGQRVPMNPHLGDVQAPSPGPGSEEFKKHHHRKHSSRGGPPGSYGLHGHGVDSQDKLDKEYYQKHPELREKEHYHPLHDRQNDFAMSSSDLNKLVRETASRGAGFGTDSDYHATPTDEVAFQAHEEYASRMASPRPASTGPERENEAPSSGQAFRSEVTSPSGDKVVHVDDAKYPEYRSYGDGDNVDTENGNEYSTPILASDEVGKDPSAYLQNPAIHPVPERRGSAYETEDVPSQPTSRNVNLSHSNNSQQEFGSTSLEDVREYEPLFPEDDKDEKQKAEQADEQKARHHFPSKDIWEDAPSSVHYTAEVSTPEVPDDNRRKSSTVQDRPQTPAHAFARHQEELAERDASSRPETYVPHTEEKPTWVDHQAHLKRERPHAAPRFPSRDIWEDAPESHLYETTVSSPQIEDTKPEAPTQPSKKSPEIPERPAIPTRPKPRQTPSDEARKTRPPVLDKPKPQIPPRPSKSPVGDSKEGEVSKPKPPVPSRPVGGKIAALQAGFMSDLNKRLKLGPQAPQVPKDEESKPEESPAEVKEKAPLSDARKGRARGPQRRAPARATAAPVSTPAATAKPTTQVLSFSLPQTFWSIDPESGDLDVNVAKAPIPIGEKSTEQASQPVEQAEKPADQTEKPVEEGEKLTGQVEKPVEKAEKAEKAEGHESVSPVKEVPELAKHTEPEFTAELRNDPKPEEFMNERDGGNKPDPFEQPPKQAAVHPIPPVEEQKAEEVEEPLAEEKLEVSGRIGDTEGPDLSEQTDATEGSDLCKKPGILDAAGVPQEPERPAESGVAGRPDVPVGESQEIPEQAEALEAEKSREQGEPIEEKTLAANMAGESVLEAAVEKKDEGDVINPVHVDETVKS